MAETLGLDNIQMGGIHAMATVMPWWNIDPMARLKQVAQNPQADILLGKEALNYGVKEDANYGWQYFGPISQEVGEVEFNRLINVYESIKKYGYILKKKIPIHGEYLVSGDEWVWIALGGKHRMSALVTLGWKYIPVTTRGKYGSHIVARENMPLWPNVVNGLFSEREALKVFDSRFH